MHNVHAFVKRIINIVFKGDDGNMTMARGGDEVNNEKIKYGM